MSEAPLPLPVNPPPDSGHATAAVCPNCGHAYQTPFCGVCSQKNIHPGDLSLKHAWHHLFHELLHVDGKIFDSLKLLFTRPGQLTLDFVEGRRARHVHPIRLFLVVGFLYFLFAHVNPPINLSVSLNSERLPIRIAQLLAQRGLTLAQFTAMADARISETFKPIYIAALLSRGLWLFLLFRKRLPYLAENMVMVLHLAAFSMLAWIALGSLFLLGGNRAAASALHMLVGFGYFLIAARRVYREGWLALTLKWLGTEILAAIVTVIAVGAIVLNVLLSSH